MLFTSYIFLFLFLPICLGAYAITPRRQRYLVLLALSYVFYGYWRVDFLALVIASTGINYGFALAIHHQNAQRKRKLLLTASVVLNLGFLGFFKYANFGVENFNSILNMFGFEAVSWTGIILPVGISFFTFQAMSYTIDVYREHVEPTRNPARFAAYVAMFPQLVAGPIVRFDRVRETLRTGLPLPGGLATGATLFMLGFNKKILLADQFAITADNLFNSAQGGMINAWLGSFSYTFQIYFDFSGYSDMALGLGLMLGFRFPVNFESPYKATSISDFWRRWHITLSSWFRDYLYIPLGGNRGTSRRTYINLLATMLLTGLWHGAQWTFVLWGAYHALFLLVERRFDRKVPIIGNAPVPVRVGVTFVLVNLGWVLFRSPNLETAARIYSDMFNPATLWMGFGTDAGTGIFALLCAAAVAIVFVGKSSNSLVKDLSVKLQVVQFLLFILACHELFAKEYSPFLYFQF